MASIEKLSRVTQKAITSGEELPQTLSFFRIFENPIDSCQVVVAHTPPGSFNIPIDIDTFLRAC